MGETTEAAVEAAARAEAERQCPPGTDLSSYYYPGEHDRAWRAGFVAHATHAAAQAQPAPEADERGANALLALADDVEYVHACWLRWKEPGVVVDAQYREERARVDEITARWRWTYHGVPNMPIPLDLYPSSVAAFRHLAQWYGRSQPAPRTVSDEITTVEALDALGASEAVIDRDGDVWARRGGAEWWTPETHPASSEHLVRKWGPLRVLSRRPTPDPIAPDALREAVARAWYDAEYGSTWVREKLDRSWPIAREALLPRADAVLAVVAKHRDAEVERLERVARTTSDAFGALDDRITRALPYVDRDSIVHAILTGTDQEASRGRE